METQNCIAIYLSSSLGLPKAGIHFLPVPAEGVPPDLLADVAPYLHEEQLDYRGQTLSVTAPTWEAVRVAVEADRAKRAQDGAERTARSKADRERKEKEAAERDARTAQWRALAARYLAGEDLPTKGGGYHLNLDGIDSDQTNVGRDSDELRSVLAEQVRRITQLRAENEHREAATLATRTTARRALLAQHGTPDQVERFDAGVLPPNELERTILDAVLPTTLGGATEYALKSKTDIEHDDDCNASEYEECKVEFSVEDGEGCPLSSIQWAALKAIRTAAEQIPGAVVDVRKRVATLSCSCSNPTWLTARVRVKFVDANLEVQRQYALGAE